MAAVVAVERVRTPWTTSELLAAYADAWRAVVLGEPSRAALAVLWGQATLECGRGGRACYCHNVGNVRAGELEPHCLLPGAYEFAAPGQVPPGATIIPTPAGAAQPPGTVCYLPPAKAQRFRAYSSLAEGCAGKLGLVARRWPRALDALRGATGAEAARGYVMGLLVPPAYMTGDAGQYLASVWSLASECLRGPEEQWPRDAAGDATGDATGDAEQDLGRRDTLPSPVEVPQAVDFVASLADSGPSEESS